MAGDHRLCRSEIRRVVGAKTEIGAAFGVSGNCVKKASLHDPVFMVATFRPRIWKKHKDPLKKHVRWQRRDAFFGFGFEKDEIGQLSPVTFSHGPFHAVAEQIDAEAELLGMRCRIVGEEMPVPSTDFERDARMRGEELCKLTLQSRAAGVAMGDEFSGAGGSVHSAGLRTGKPGNASAGSADGVGTGAAHWDCEVECRPLP